MLIDITKGNCLKSMYSHNSNVSSIVSFSTNRIVSVCSWGSDGYNNINVWDSADGKCLKTICNETNLKKCIAKLSKSQVNHK